MRDPERIDKVLDDIGQTWKQHPDMRLGQLLWNALWYRGEHPTADIAVEKNIQLVEDEQLASFLRRFHEIYRPNKEGTE